MTSVTERLRALLDERGVEWTYEYGTVSYASDGRWFHAWAYNDGVMCVSMGYLTPEQAVAATLGPGTCHAVFEVDAMSENERIGEFVCSECGETFGDGHGEFPRYCPNCGRKVVA